MDFILQAIRAGQFQAGNNVYPLNAIKPEELERFNMSERNAHLTGLKTVKNMLDKLRVKDDLDCDCVSVEDEILIKKLVAAVLCDNSVDWPESNDTFPEVSIANLNIKLCVLKDEKNEGCCRVFEYSDAPIGFMIKDEFGQQTEVSYHVFLKKESMLKCCNIDYGALVRQLKTIPISNEYSGALVWLLLEMLHAFDASKCVRHDILEGATELATWLRREDCHTPQDLLDLNYYQTIKRSRKLNPREIQCLFSIIESKPTRKDIYVGTYLLLEDFASAQYYYDTMEEDERKAFVSYPISHFLPGT